MKNEAGFTLFQQRIVSVLSAHAERDVPIGVVYQAIYFEPCEGGNSVETRRVAAHVTRINRTLKSLRIVSGKTARTYRLVKRN